MPKTTEVFFSLILLQAKSPKLRCQQGHTSREISKGHSVLCLFQVLVAPSIPLACVASTLICLHFHFASSSSICIKSLLSLLQRQLSLKLGPTQIIQNDLFISRYLMTTANTLFPNKITVTVSGNQDMDKSFLGLLFNLQQKITSIKIKVECACVNGECG